MPCDKLKVIEDTPATDTTTHNPQSTQEKTNMSSTLVMRRMPEFEIEAYDAASGHSDLNFAGYLHLMEIDVKTQCFPLV